MEGQDEKRQYSPGTELLAESPNGFEIVRKGVEVVDGLQRDSVWISTEKAESRGNGDVLVATGCRFDEYLKNPVVGWNHGRGSIDFPVAKSLLVEIVAGVGVASTFEWVPWHYDDPEHGIEAVDDIHKLWDGRFLNAASVWCKILASELLEGHEKDWWPPLKIHEWLLLEWAIVYVPMNQAALRRSLRMIGEAKSYDRICRRARQRLERQSPREEAEARRAGDCEGMMVELLQPLVSGVNQLSQRVLDGRK